MVDKDPYEPPSANVDANAGVRDPSLERLASAQKFAIYCVLGYLAMMVLAIFVPSDIVMGVIGLVLLIAIMFAVGQMSRALGGGWILTIIGVLLMLIPLFGLILLLVLNARATRRLKAGGYVVGFMGAKPASA